MLNIKSLSQCIYTHIHFLAKTLGSGKYSFSYLLIKC